MIYTMELRISRGKRSNVYAKSKVICFDGIVDVELPLTNDRNTSLMLFANMDLSYLNLDDPLISHIRRYGFTSEN
jgi:hypothetical protein